MGANLVRRHAHYDQTLVVPAGVTSMRVTMFDRKEAPFTIGDTVSATFVNRGGRLWGAGFNSVGQVGTELMSGDTPSYSAPLIIPRFVNFQARSIRSFGASSAVVDDAGQAFMWGASGLQPENALGLAGFPWGIAFDGEGWKKMIVGNDTQAAAGIDFNSQLWTWGSAGSPTLIVIGGTNFLVLDACVRAFVHYYRDNNGDIYYKGTPGGALPVTTSASLITTTTRKFKQLVASDFFWVGLDINGNMVAQGVNNNGALGTGVSVGATMSSATVIVSAASFSIAQVFAGNDPSSNSAFTGFLTTDGKLYLMGGNSKGLLGQGDNTDRSTPTLVTAPTANSWVYFDAPGGSSAMGSDTAGNLISWGDNSQGQLMLNDVTSRSTPTLISTFPVGVPVIDTRRVMPRDTRLYSVTPGQSLPIIISRKFPLFGTEEFPMATNPHFELEYFL